MGLKPNLLDLSSFSDWTLLVGSFDPLSINQSINQLRYFRWL